MSEHRPVTPDDRREMDRMVKELLGEKSEAWWTTTNPNFGRAPCWLIASPVERRLRDFIFQAYEDEMAARKARTAVQPSGDQ